MELVPHIVSRYCSDGDTAHSMAYTCRFVGLRQLSHPYSRPRRTAARTTNPVWLSPFLTSDSQMLVRQDSGLQASGSSKNLQAICEDKDLRRGCLPSCSQLPSHCPPSLPFPSVSKTSFHRPWSWTSFLLSSASVSWVFPHQSHPHQDPVKT